MAGPGFGGLSRQDWLLGLLAVAIAARSRGAPGPMRSYVRSLIRNSRSRLKDCIVQQVVEGQLSRSTEVAEP